MLVAHVHRTFRAYRSVPFRALHEDTLAFLDPGPVAGPLGFVYEFLQRAVTTTSPKQAGREKDCDIFHVTPQLPRGASLALAVPEDGRTDHERWVPLGSLRMGNWRA